MKIKIKLPEGKERKVKILVEKGEKVKANAPLFLYLPPGKKQKIPVAKLLNIPSASLLRYLKKKVGEKVFPEEILAEKKGFLSSCLLRSPFEGEITEVDLHKGEIVLTSFSFQEKKFLVPVEAKILTVEKDFLEIEFPGEVFWGKRGEGKEVWGEFFYLSGENLGVWDIQEEVSAKVVLCQRLKEESWVKLEVLGTQGVIILEKKEGNSLPWIEIDKETFSQLVSFSGKKKKIWLRPEAKEIIIFS